MLRMNESHLQLRSKVSLAHVNVAALNFYNNRFKLHTKDFSIIVCSAAMGLKRAVLASVKMQMAWSSGRVWHGLLLSDFLLPGLHGQLCS